MYESKDTQEVLSLPCSCVTTKGHISLGLRFQSYKTRGLNLTFQRLLALFSLSATAQCFQGIPKAFLSIDLFVVFEAPLGSVVSNQLSCQAGIMLGGLLASTGFILGSFATSLKHLYLSLGVLTGKRTFFHKSDPTFVQVLSRHKHNRDL
jgi:hypothetical protein